MYAIVLSGLLILGCKEKVTEKNVTDKKVEFNQNLSDELKRIAEIDQIAAYIPEGDYKKLSEKELRRFLANTDLSDMI